MEVGAVVTSECESAAGLTNIILTVAGKPKHAFPLLYRLIQNGKPIPRSPEQGNGGGSGYCCVYLPDGSASLAPTRNGQLIKDMLSSLCEKRGFPLKDIVIYLQGKDKVGAHLLRTHHYRWTQCSRTLKQTLVFFFSILLQQPLSLDQDCSVLRDQQVTLELRVKFVWVNTSFLLFFGLCHPSRHPRPHPHPQCSTSFMTTCKTKHVRIHFGCPAEILLRVSYFFHQWPM